MFDYRSLSILCRVRCRIRVRSVRLLLESGPFQRARSRSPLSDRRKCSTCRALRPSDSLRPQLQLLSLYAANSLHIPFVLSGLSGSRYLFHCLKQVEISFSFLHSQALLLIGSQILIQPPCHTLHRVHRVSSKSIFHFISKTYPFGTPFLKIDEHGLYTFCKLCSVSSTRRKLREHILLRMMKTVETLVAAAEKITAALDA